MDASEQRMNLKKMVVYLEQVHGIHYSVNTIHQLRTRGEGPPAHKRRHRLEYVASELDAWVAGLDARDAARENKRLGRSPLSLESIALKLVRAARVALSGEPPPPIAHGFVHCQVMLPPQLRAALLEMAPMPPSNGRERGRWEAERLDLLDHASGFYGARRR